jgi:hypothetical protein
MKSFCALALGSFLWKGIGSRISNGESRIGLPTGSECDREIGHLHWEGQSPGIIEAQGNAGLAGIALGPG